MLKKISLCLAVSFAVGALNANAASIVAQLRCADADQTVSVHIGGMIGPYVVGLPNVAHYNAAVNGQAVNVTAEVREGHTKMSGMDRIHSNFISTDGDASKFALKFSPQSNEWVLTFRGVDTAVTCQGFAF